MQNVDSLLITNSYFSYGVQTNNLLITHPPPPHQPKDQDTSLMIFRLRIFKQWTDGDQCDQKLKLNVAHFWQKLPKSSHNYFN